jgi:hypothetical protein
MRAGPSAFCSGRAQLLVHRLDDWAAYIREGPPPIITDTARTSMISSRVAPWRSAAWTWNAMQGSQREPTDNATAISSFVLGSSAPSLIAWTCIRLKPFSVSGCAVFRPALAVVIRLRMAA